LNSPWTTNLASLLLAILTSSLALGQRARVPVPDIRAELASMPGPDGLPARLFDIRKRGAAANGTVKDTAVFQKAIDECSASGGGQVRVAAGDYLIGAISLRSNAIYIKSRPGRGGVIENVTCRNLEVRSCDGAFLRINLLQSGKQDPEPVPGFQGIPLARNLSFSNVRLQQCGGVAEATLISPERPVEGLSLIQISGQASKGMALAHIRDVRLDVIQVTGCNGPLLQTQDVTGTGLEAASPLD
jgi:polygalacturonase